MEKYQDQEREGEDEVPQGAVVAPAPEAQADADLGVLGLVPPLLPEAPDVVKDEKEGDAKAPEEEKAKVEAEAPESEESKAAKALRNVHLKRVAAFYKERNIYFQGKRNVSDTAKAEFKAQSRAGIQDSPLATITKNGTLILRKKEDSKREAGKIIYKILYQISVPSYRDPTQEEHGAIQKRRIAAVKTAEEAFEMARDSLRTLNKIKTTTFEEIKEAMRLVREADLTLQTARFAEKELTPYDIPLALLTLDKQDSGRVVAGGFAGTPMTLQQQYAVEEVGGVVEEPKLREHPSDVILVCFPEENAENGFMSSWFKKEFTFNKREYSCAFQAIMSEMARIFGNSEEADRIMDEDDPMNMILFWDKVEVGEGMEPITEESWNKQLAKVIKKVNLEKFKNVKMAQLLAATGTYQIGYIPPENQKDMFQGTGLPFDDEKAYQPPAWIGKNIYGKVLEEIRIKVIEKLGSVAKKPDAKKTKSVPAPELAINRAPVAAAPAPIVEEGEEEAVPVDVLPPP